MERTSATTTTTTTLRDKELPLMVESDKNKNERENENENSNKTNKLNIVMIYLDSVSRARYLFFFTYSPLKWEEAYMQIFIFPFLRYLFYYLWLISSLRGLPQTTAFLKEINNDRTSSHKYVFIYPSSLPPLLYLSIYIYLSIQHSFNSLWPNHHRSYGFVRYNVVGSNTPNNMVPGLSGFKFVVSYSSLYSLSFNTLK